MDAALFVNKEQFISLMRLATRYKRRLLDKIASDNDQAKCATLPVESESHLFRKKEGDSIYPPGTTSQRILKSSHVTLITLAREKIL